MNPGEVAKENVTKKAEVSAQSGRCFNCGATSKERLLLSCSHQGEECYVCARCLPMFIHGAQ